MTNGLHDQPSDRPEGLSESDDRALDAMLQAFFERDSRTAPPRRDFTEAVLRESARRAPVRPQGLGEPSEGKSRRNISIAVWSSLAASVLAVVAFSAFRSYRHGGGTPSKVAVRAATPAPQRPQTPGRKRTREIATPADELASSQASSTTISKSPASAGSSPTPKSPVLLSGDTDPLSRASEPNTTATAKASDTDSTGPNRPAAAPMASELAANDPSGPSSPPKPPIDDLAGLAKFDEQFRGYWISIGVTPANLSDPLAWSDRIADRFGIAVQTSPEAGDDKGGDESALADATQDNDAIASRVAYPWHDPAAARELARRLVSELSRDLRPGRDRLEALIETAARTIHRGDRFDHWLAEWVEELASSHREPQPKNRPGATYRPEVLGEWFASKIAGADAACARCHDSPIDSRWTQQDYWSTAAMFVDAKSATLFYELPDGRQKVATPAIPERWLPAPSPSTPLSPSPTLAIRDRIIGNRQVARTLANHLWSIGFGTPMVSPTSSPIAAPHDDALGRGLDMLADRLLATDFDIRAAADWVIRCDPMRRGLPEVFLQDRWQIASEEALAAASLAQRSFAAARAHWPMSSSRQLIAMMNSRSSGLPTTIATDRTVLAQPLLLAPARRPGIPPTTTGPTQRPADEDYWWAQWLADREGLRGGWMESISDIEEQRRHAFYAAGYRDVAPEQIDIARQITGPSEGDEEARREAIAKLFWIIRNGR